MRAMIYVFFSPFPLFLSVYVYASVCDFVCIPLLLPFVLGYSLSVFLFSFLLLKKFFFLISIFYFNNFILFYFILFYFMFFFLSFFSPFCSETCGGQALGAPARHQGCATEMGQPCSGHWSTRDLPAPHNRTQALVPS